MSFRIKPSQAAAFVCLLGLFAMLSFFSEVSHAFGIPKPSQGLMPNPVKGKTLFAANCAACHGVSLNGTENGPPLLHRIYEPSHHSDAAFQLAVKNGVRAHHWRFGDMPAIGTLNPDDVAHITAFVRMEQRKVGIQ